MFNTVETEIVRAHTRLDGVDARLKNIEKDMKSINEKVSKLTWKMGLICGAASTAGPVIMVIFDI